MYTAIPHLSPIGLSVIHQADEKHVDVTFQRIKVDLPDPGFPETQNIPLPYLSHSAENECSSKPFCFVSQGESKSHRNVLVWAMEILSWRSGRDLKFKLSSSLCCFATSVRSCCVRIRL